MQVTMDQIRELADHYDQSGLGNSSSGRFLRSIVKEGTMPRGRGVAWLSELIEKGPPTNMSALITEIEDLINRSPRADTQEQLKVFLGKIRSGWELSEYQKTTLERLRNQVNDALPDLTLDEKQIKLLQGLIARKRCMSPYYWAARPAISKRLDEIFVRWTIEQKISPDDWDFLRGHFKSCINDLDGNKHPVGALRWTRSGEPVTVMKAMSLNQSGRITVGVLTTRGIESIEIERLLTRAPK